MAQQYDIVTYKISIQLPKLLAETKHFQHDAPMYDILKGHLPFKDPTCIKLTTLTVNKSYLCQVVPGSSGEWHIVNMPNIIYFGNEIGVSVQKTDVINKHINQRGVVYLPWSRIRNNSADEVLNHNPDVATCTQMRRYNYRTGHQMPLPSYIIQMKRNKTLPRAVLLDQYNTRATVNPYIILPVRCDICLRYTHSTALQCPMRFKNEKNCGTCGKTQPLDAFQTTLRQKRTVVKHSCTRPYACPNCPSGQNDHSPSDNLQCPIRKGLYGMPQNSRDPGPEPQMAPPMETEMETEMEYNPEPSPPQTLSAHAYTLRLSETIEEVLYTPEEISQNKTHELSLSEESIASISTYKTAICSDDDTDDDEHDMKRTPCKYTNIHHFIKQNKTNSSQFFIPFLLYFLPIDQISTFIRSHLYRSSNEQQSKQHK